MYTVHTTGTSSGGSAALTGSYSFPANKRLLVSVTSRRWEGAGIPTLEGCGVTWTVVASVVRATHHRITLFQAIGTPTTGALTIDFAGLDQEHISWVPISLNTDGAVVQSNTGAGVSSTVTISLSAFANAKHATFSFWCHHGDGDALTAESGYAVIATRGFPFGTAAQQVHLLGTSDTTPSVSHSSETEEVAGIAIEIAIVSIVISDSAHLSHGGATTAQLTVPSGKTFLAGKVGETTDPLVVDLALNNYTELEWSLEITDGAEFAAYEFRVVEADDTPLDVYTVTPELTVVAAIIVEAAASLTVQATMSSTPRKQAMSSVTLLAAVEMMAEGGSKVDAIAELDVDVFMESEASRIQANSASLLLWALLEAIAINASAPNAQLVVDAVLSGDTQLIARVLADLEVSAELELNPGDLERGSAEFSADVVMTADGGVFFQASSQLSVVAILIADIELLRSSVDLDTLVGKMYFEVYQNNVLIGGGPITRVFDSYITHRINKAGEWGLTMSVIDEYVDLLQHGREVRIYREGEGMIGRGLIDYSKKQAVEGD